MTKRLKLAEPNIPDPEYRTHVAKSGRRYAVHFVLKMKIEMPPTFSRVRYFSTFLQGNGKLRIGLWMFGSVRIKDSYSEMLAAKLGC
jgi:hypothetical protein